MHENCFSALAQKVGAAQREFDFEFQTLAFVRFDEMAVAQYTLGEAKALLNVSTH